MKTLYFLGFVLLVTISSFSQGSFYIVCQDRSFYSIDLDNCTSELIGNTENVINDITYDPTTDHIYGIDNLGNLVIIDPLTADLTLVGYAIPGITALTVNNQGFIYAMEQNNLYFINKETGYASFLGSTPDNIRSAGDMTFYRGDIYLTTIGRQLAKIDISNLANSTILGDMDINEYIFGFTSVSCTPSIYACPEEDIYILDSLDFLSSTLLCSNIVNSVIYGSASTSEYIDFTPINNTVDSSICFTDHVLPLDATTYNGSYLWNDSSTHRILEVTTEGLYWVEVQVENCKFRDSTFVHSKKPPFLELGNDTTLCDGETIILSTEDESAYHLWNDQSINPTLTVQSAGSYSVKYNIDGCSSYDTIVIDYQECIPSLILPNIFTPNNDSYNNLFTPIVSERIQSMITHIYNRDGKLIYATEEKFINWDGDQVNDGVYFYHILYKDMDGYEHNLKGHFTLLR